MMVVGGGCTGVAAALSAAREGANTVLVERTNALAGMGSNAWVHTLCGLFHPDVARGPQWLNPGLPTEIGMAVQALTGQGPELMGRVYVLRHEPRQLADLAAQLCAAEARLTVLWGAEVGQVTRHEGQWRVTVKSGGDAEEILAASLVDATGEALLTRWCSPESRAVAAGERLYRPALVCRVQGLAAALGADEPLQIAGCLVRGVQSGLLPKAALSATFRQSPVASEEVFLTLDLEAGGAEWDSSNEAMCERVCDEGKELAGRVWDFLRREHHFFASSSGLGFPSHLGIRESSRWVGDHVLTGAEVVSSKRFADEVALAGWPLEMRETARGPKFRYFESPEPAGIPAGSLRSAKVPGVFFAGRCISCDHEALASVRVMGTCLATGQAAGRLAAQDIGP